MFTRKFIIISVLVLVTSGLIISSLGISFADNAIANEIASTDKYISGGSNRDCNSNLGNAKIEPIPGAGNDIKGIWGWIKKHVIKPVVAWACQRWPKYIPEAACDWAHDQRP